MEGRKEKRISQRIPVLLSSLAQPLHAEQASTEDITSYGVRVETGRQWELGSIVLVKSPQGRPHTCSSGLLQASRTQGVQLGIGICDAQPRVDDAVKVPSSV